MSDPWVLNRLNLVCRIGDVLALRAHGVESGSGSVWLRTDYPAQTRDDVPDGSMRVEATPELLKVAKDGGKFLEFERIVHGAGFQLDFHCPDEIPPEAPSVPIDLTHQMFLSTTNLEAIVKAAKAGKAKSIMFRPSDPGCAITFELFDDQDASIAVGAVTQVAFNGEPA